MNEALARAIAEALRTLADGRAPQRLAAEAGEAPEARLASAFNRLLAAAGERDELLRQSLALEEARDLHRDMALRFEQELTDERRTLAGALEEELAQHSTTIRSLAATLAHRLAGRDAVLEPIAALLLQSSDALIEALRALTQRLRADAIGAGLLDALRAQVADWRLAHPAVRFELLVDPADEAAFGVGAAETESTAEHVVQDAVGYALEHGTPTLVLVSLRVDGGLLTVQVSDDGRHSGARVQKQALDAVRTRVLRLGGLLQVNRGESGGIELLATLPWSGSKV